MNHYLYSNAGYRAKLVSTHSGIPLHWLFLPGGPGLGSESFGNLCDVLSLPGNTWLIDYPNDGSNQNSHYPNFDTWKEGLIDFLQSFNNVIVVAHSFSGMFVLSDSKIEKSIKGLVLINTSPNKNWMQAIAQEAEKYQLPDLSHLQNQYLKHPSNSLFKKLTIASAPYFFSEATLDAGRALLESLPYSHAAYDWAAQYFHPTYEAQWIPQDIPTLIIGGELDHITPLSLFQNERSWKRDNIFIECIKDTGHFSWINHASQIKALFDEFCGQVDI